MRFWTVERRLIRTVALVLLAALVAAAAWLLRSGGGGLLPAGTAEEPPVPVAAATAEAPEPDGAAQPEDDKFETYGPARTDFFVEYRLEREMARGRQVELLQSVAQDAETGEAQRAAAQERLLRITENLEREVGLENILKAKGFSNAVVHFQDDLVTVIVAEPLSEADAADIINLAARAAGVTHENVLLIGHEVENPS